MPSERTFVTEVATGLGMVGDDDLASVIEQRPGVMSNLRATNWEHLASLWASGTYDADFLAGFLNGQAFSEGSRRAQRTAAEDHRVDWWPPASRRRGRALGSPR
jgi:hypothetical protein